MGAALAVQRLVGERLATDPAVIALVPAAAIVDSYALPETFPSIILGEGAETMLGEASRHYVRVSTVLHLWERELGLVGVKAIAGAARRALDARPWPVDGTHVADLRVTGARFMRDPEAGLAHGVVSIEAVVEEREP